MGAITPNEFKQEAFEDGHLDTADDVEKAFKQFADHGGYSNVEDTQLRRLTFAGDSFNIRATVNQATNSEVHDTVYSDTSWMIEHENSVEEHFFISDLPELVRTNPNLFFQKMRNEFPNEQIDGYTLSVRPDDGEDTVGMISDLEISDYHRDELEEIYRWMYQEGIPREVLVEEYGAAAVTTVETLYEAGLIGPRHDGTPTSVRVEGSVSGPRTGSISFVFDGNTGDIIEQK